MVSFPSHRGLLLAILLFVGISGAYLMGGGNMAGDGTQSERSDAETISWYWPGTPPLYSVTWAIRTGQVSTPEGVELVDAGGYRQLTQSAISGRSDVGYVAILKTPTVVDRNRDLLLNGYGYHVNSTYYTMYARNDTDITALSDLNGTRVGVPLTLSLGILTLMGMEDAGVDLDTVTVVDKPLPALKPLLESGDVDAAFLSGSHPEFREVAHPQRYWERRHDTRVPTLFWYMDGRQYAEESRKVAFTLNRSLTVADQNMEEVIAAAMDETGQDLTMHIRGLKGTRTFNMTERDWRTAQNIIDYAYEHDHIDTTVDLRSLVHR